LVGTATLLGVALVVSACSGSDSSAEAAAVAPETTTQPVATTVVAGTTTTTVATTDEEVPSGPQPLPGEATLRPVALEAGEYTTTVMTPTIVFSVDEGWLRLGEFDPLLIMSRVVTGGRQQDFLNFVTFPSNTVDAVVEIIQNEPGAELEVTDAQPASLAGAEGISFIAKTTVPGGGSVESFAFPNDRLYARVPLDPPRFEDGDRTRYTIVQVGDDVLVIIAGADEDLDFDAFLEAADEVLASVTFGETPAS